MNELTRKTELLVSKITSDEKKYCTFIVFFKTSFYPLRDAADHSKSLWLSLHLPRRDTSGLYS